MDKIMLMGFVSGVVTATAGGTVAGYHRGAAMIGRLLKNFVQEVPEGLSVCEFDCPNSECTVSDWVDCKLRRRLSLVGSDITDDVSRLVRLDAPALATSAVENTELN